MAAKKSYPYSQGHKFAKNGLPQWYSKDKFGITPMPLDDFHVVLVISNPARYRRRYDLYRQALYEMHEDCPGLNIWVVETAFGDRPYEITEQMISEIDDGDHNIRHIQFRTSTEIWHKENMINLAIARLPQSAKYVAWVDADIFFQRGFATMQATKQALQHYDFVQMFSHCVDLGPNGETLKVDNGFMWSYWQNRDVKPEGSGYGGYYGFGKGKPFWHPGYAWAARIDAINKVGGLLECAILGSGDHHMAMALIGHVEKSVPGDFYRSANGKLDITLPGYRFYEQLKLWEDRCDRYIRGRVGFVPGTVSHKFHGKKRDRQYVPRWQILKDNKYNPTEDIKKDYQGLWTFAGNKPKFERAVHRYFHSRNEDSVDADS